MDIDNTLVFIKEGWRSINAILTRPSNTGPPTKSPAGHLTKIGKARSGDNFINT
jgi:hypothetical protein